LADVYRLQKQYGKAADSVEKSLSADANYAPAHNERGAIARDQKQYGDAVAAFAKAHELDPGEPVFPYNLAETHRLQKQYGKATGWVEKTLFVDATYAWAHNQRGLIAQDQQQYEPATEAFKRAFELDPGEEQFAFEVGWNLLEALNYAESEVWAQRTLGMNSEHLGAQNLLGAIAFTRRRWAEAEQIFRRLAASHSSELALHYNVASTCMRLGRFAEAHEQISIALQMDPDDPSANELLATFDQLTDSPEAVVLAQRALDLEPGFSSLLVFAVTRPTSNSSTERDDALSALSRALDEASQLDREDNFDMVIYALRVLEQALGSGAVRQAVLENRSPVWEAFRQAIAHLEQMGAPPQDPVVASIVAGLCSQLPPKEQLFAAWGVDPPKASLLANA
jgi:tetratricopeptide (TPR) repeat protein